MAKKWIRRSVEGDTNINTCARCGKKGAGHYVPDRGDHLHARCVDDYITNHYGPPREREVEFTMEVNSDWDKDPALFEARFRPKVCQLIQIIEEKLVNMNRDERNDAWALLTALRGPDGHGSTARNDLKYNSTARIRAILFPGLTSATCGSMNMDGKVPGGGAAYAGDLHFRNHVLGAVEAMSYKGEAVTRDGIWLDPID